MDVIISIFLGVKVSSMHVFGDFFVLVFSIYSLVCILPVLITYRQEPTYALSFSDDWIMTRCVLF